MIVNIQSKGKKSDYLQYLPQTEKMSHKLKLILSNRFAPTDPFVIEEYSTNTSKIPKVIY